MATDLVKFKEAVERALALSPGAPTETIVKVLSMTVDFNEFDQRRVLSTVASKIKVTNAQLMGLYRTEVMPVYKPIPVLLGRDGDNYTLDVPKGILLTTPHKDVIDLLIADRKMVYAMSQAAWPNTDLMNPDEET